jgi:enoyl-CoA hydratase
MSETIREEPHGQVRVLILDRGANALDPGLMDALGKRLLELSEGGYPPLVLASAHPTVFCPGWDLRVLEGAGQEAVLAFLRSYDGLLRTLVGYPGPTVAAIAGHAVAGGCLLALACDHRVMARGRARIGLSEVNLGAPVPAGALELLAARLPRAVAERLVLEGDGLPADRALAEGLVQTVVPGPDHVLERARTRAASLGARPARAYATAKAFLNGQLLSRMERAAAAGEEAFLACWLEEATQDRVAAVLRRLEE